MSDEQRTSPRVTVNQSFRTLEAFLDAYVTDVSLAGAFVKTTNPLPVGTEVDLRFDVAVEDIETIVGRGRVVRVVDEGPGPRGMGIAFVELTPESRALIERLTAS